jgi:hypothetical protein
MGAPDFILENGAARDVVPSISIAGLLALIRDAMLAKAEEAMPARDPARGG